MTKDELLEKVWPGVIVEENTIHSQISALRKALGLARDLLQTVPGRGYVLLTSHSESEEASDKGPTREVPRIGTRGQTNLPPAGTTLVGRDLEIQLVLRALTISRLVTLTGPAGIGKTRLSQEVARDRLHAYPDGVFWIELASISNPENVAQALGRTIGLPASAQSPEQIVRGIGPRAMLILLDNCEHVLESVAVLAEAIIQRTAAAHILTTTRDALRIDHESIFAVPGLDLPDPGTVDTGVIASCGAVRLFLERAQSAGLNISLEAPMAQSVLEICRRLGVRLQYFDEALTTLDGAIRDVSRALFVPYLSTFRTAEAEALMATGRLAAAGTVLDTALGEAQQTDDRWFLPELMCVKAEFIAISAPNRVEEAEDLLATAYGLAKSGGAKAWQLRIAASTARLARQTGRPREGLAQLARICREFDHRFPTDDLVAAEQLLSNAGEGSA